MGDQDTYENRALFMMMWHGSPSGKLPDLFPNWYREKMRLKSGSVEETLWMAKFCGDAMEKRNHEREMR